MDEAFGMDAVGGIENGLALFEDERGLVVVDHCRCEQAQPRVTMFLVVPTKKSLRKSSAILNAPEAVRELRPVFHGAELAFRIRIDISDHQSNEAHAASQDRCRWCMVYLASTHGWRTR